MIGLSTMVSKSSARNVLVDPAIGINAVCTFFHPDGSSTLTSWGRAARSTRVRNVGAPLIIAKPASTQLLRTVISRL